MMKSSGLDVTLIHQRMGNHAGPSGYDRLADYLDARLIRAPDSDWNFAQRALARSFRPLQKRSGSFWYHRESMYAELCAAWEWTWTRNHIFHFLYGENCHRFLGCMKRTARRNHIVSTYHTPPDKFKKVVGDMEHLRRIDALIVVSRSQVEFFAEIVGPERVFYVPHGIDTDYFSPGIEKSRDDGRLRCLFVGTHLRDYATLACAMKLLNDRGEMVDLTVVTFAEFHHHFRGMPNVQTHARVSDRELLDLYRQSDILVLPLLGSTANNSILEAMACALPLIITDLPGTRDYVTEECSSFIPEGDPGALAEAIVSLQGNQALRHRMGAKSRERALAFSWENVARQTLRVYTQVAS